MIPDEKVDRDLYVDRENASSVEGPTIPGGIVAEALTVRFGTRVQPYVSGSVSRCLPLLDALVVAVGRWPAGRVFQFATVCEVGPTRT